MTRRALSWKPVRRGPIYCAPACGLGCTWLAFKRVTRAAEALARRLGKGWEPEVWENLGWHYSVTRGGKRGKVKITESDGRFRVWLSEDGLGTLGLWIVEADFARPEDAVVAQLREARAAVARYQRIIDAAFPASGGRGRS